MFRKGGPRPWHTKPGGSLLDQHILDVQRLHGHKSEGGIMGNEGQIEYADKGEGSV